MGKLRLIVKLFLEAAFSFYAYLSELFHVVRLTKLGTLIIVLSAAKGRVLNNANHFSYFTCRLLLTALRFGNWRQGILNGEPSPLEFTIPLVYQNKCLLKFMLICSLWTKSSVVNYVIFGTDLEPSNIEYSQDQRISCWRGSDLGLHCKTRDS